MKNIILPSDISISQHAAERFLERIIKRVFRLSCGYQKPDFLKWANKALRGDSRYYYHTLIMCQNINSPRSEPIY